MKERPILMSAPMVLAILAGRKTQTRRIIKPQPQRYGDVTHCDPEQADLIWHPIGGVHQENWPNPYGNARQRLWVRETWKTWERPRDGMDGVIFGCDGTFQPIENSEAASDLWVAAHNNGKHGNKWRPSIFMPRWASRITLEIAGVRVERVQDISEEDAKSEGIEPERDYTQNRMGAYYKYQYLWNEINGPDSWQQNPWVWVLTFKRITP